MSASEQAAAVLPSRSKSPGVWGVRHSVARKWYCCGHCSAFIGQGETYWRYYGKMAEAMTPYMVRLCERCSV